MWKMKQLASLDNLIDLFSSLPQITKKQAKNIALYLINKDEAYIDKFFLALKNSKNKLHFCSQCNCLTEKNKCDICCDYTRDFSKLCIVTSNDDLEKIESTESFKGLYFVLNKELDAKKNAGFEEDVLHKLLDLISLYKPNEIIMATN
jgi:recombination protein RecR